jgi:hypothetical protein
MADVREVIELAIADGWVLVEVDPDADGYTEMIIEKITDERDTMWSTSNALVDGAKIPYQARYDYDVYLKMTKDAILKKHRFAITRML